MLLESKGRFLSADRVKMQAVQEQNPDKLIVMLFARPTTKISKKSKTRYKDWCDKKGIVWLGFNDKDWVYKLQKIIKEWKKRKKTS